MTARISTEEGKALIGIFPNEICEIINDFLIDKYRDPYGCRGESWFYYHWIKNSDSIQAIKEKVENYDKEGAFSEPNIRLQLTIQGTLSYLSRSWMNWEDVDLDYDAMSEKEAKEILFRCRTDRARKARALKASIAKRTRSTFREGADLASWRPKKKFCIREVDL